LEPQTNRERTKNQLPSPALQDPKGWLATQTWYAPFCRGHYSPHGAAEMTSAGTLRKANDSVVGTLTYVLDECEWLKVPRLVNCRKTREYCGIRLPPRSVLMNVRETKEEEPGADYVL